MSIVVAADKHCFGGYFLGSLQNIVLIPFLDLQRHRPKNSMMHLTSYVSKVTQNEALA